MKFCNLRCPIFSHKHRPNIGISRLKEADQFLRILCLLLGAALAVPNHDFR